MKAPRDLSELIPEIEAVMRSLSPAHERNADIAHHLPIVALADICMKLIERDPANEHANLEVLIAILSAHSEARTAKSVMGMARETFGGGGY